jgi:hypothetical protein
MIIAADMVLNATMEMEMLTEAEAAVTLMTMALVSEAVRAVAPPDAATARRRSALTTACLH